MAYGRLTTTAAAAPQVPHLIVSTVDSEPFVYRETPATGGEVYNGYLVDLLEEVSRRAGFTFEFKQSSDGTFGANQPGGWTGIIGDVAKGVADLGCAPITSTVAREEAVDFTKPFMTSSVNLLVEKPTWSDFGIGYLVRPFSSDYWIMTFVCLLLIGIIFFIIGKFSPYEWGNAAAERDPRNAKNSFSLRNSYLFALSSLSWQGYREAPKSLSGRIMAAFWWFFVLFTLIAYTANLTAYFLARPEQIPDMTFSTYEELLENPDLNVGALNFGTTQSKLRTSRNPVLKALWAKMNSQNAWMDTYEEGVHRVNTSEGTFVFFMEAPNAEYEARRNCDLMVFGENLFPSSMAFPVQKGSVWRARINTAMRELSEEGYMSSLKDKYWKFGGECRNWDGRKFVKTGGYMSSLPIYPVTLRDMAVAILLFFLGFIVAIIFLVIEIIHYAVTKQGKKIEKPKILKNPPKIWRPKKKAAKKEPGDVEEGAASTSAPSADGESVPMLGFKPAGTSDGLESVPLEDGEEPGPSGEEVVSDENQSKPQA